MFISLIFDKKSLSLLIRLHDGTPNISSFPSFGERFPSSPRNEDRQWEPMSPAIKFSRGSYQGGEADGCAANHSLISGVGVKTAWSYTPAPYIASLQIQGQNYFYLRSVLCDTVNSSLTLKMFSWLTAKDKETPSWSLHSLLWGRPWPIPKWVFHEVRYSSSCFKFQYFLFSVQWVKNALRLFPHCPFPNIFPWIMCFRWQFVSKMWPIHLRFLRFILRSMFLAFLTAQN